MEKIDKVIKIDKIMHIVALIIWLAVLIGIISITVYTEVHSGKTNNAEIIIDNSTRFDEKEIDLAVQCVLKKFKRSYMDCELITLKYDEKESNFWINVDRMDLDNSIVLFATFKVGETYDLGFSPNSTVRDWKFYLSREDKNGEWELESWGFL